MTAGALLLEPIGSSEPLDPERARRALRESSSDAGAPSAGAVNTPTSPNDGHDGAPGGRPASGPLSGPVSELPPAPHGRRKDGTPAKKRGRKAKHERPRSSGASGAAAAAGEGLDNALFHQRRADRAESELAEAREQLEALAPVLSAEEAKAAEEEREAMLELCSAVPGTLFGLLAAGLGPHWRITEDQESRIGKALERVVRARLPQLEKISVEGALVIQLVKVLGGKLVEDRFMMAAVNGDRAALRKMQPGCVGVV